MGKEHPVAAGRRRVVNKSDRVYPNGIAVTLEPGIVDHEALADALLLFRGVEEVTLHDAAHELSVCIDQTPVVREAARHLGLGATQPKDVREWLETLTRTELLAQYLELVAQVNRAGSLLYDITDPEWHAVPVAARRERKRRATRKAKGQR